MTQQEHRGVLGSVVRGGAFALVGTASAAAMGFVLTLVVTRGLSQSAAGEIGRASCRERVCSTV